MSKTTRTIHVPQYTIDMPYITDNIEQLKNEASALIDCYNGHNIDTMILIMVSKKNIDGTYTVNGAAFDDDCACDNTVIKLSDSFIDGFTINGKTK